MPIFRSLRARVLLWVSVALVVLFALTIIALDIAFQRSTERALQELLEVQLLGLIALAEPDTRGELSVPEAVDPRFDVPESGLYGVLWAQDGSVLWQSLSLLGRTIEIDAGLPEPGEQRHLALQPPGLPPLQALLMGITWEFAGGRSAGYVLGVAVSLEPYQARQSAFRRNLIGWFAAITLTMLLVVTGLLAWVLRPLRRLEQQVREIEDGRRTRLADHYPSELTGLAANLNALIDSERRRQVRYRNTLDDLAHSLKTPLAVMRSLLTESPSEQAPRDSLTKELDRMDQRVSYQLRRARASGATGLGVEPIPVAPLVSDLRDALNKVYRQKQVHCTLDLDPGAVFQGDAGDLNEIIGNILDNAYKYCARRVAVGVAMRHGRLVLTVADDGPGIAPESVEQILQRGVRADESVPGQGIGLAVVRETVSLYDGFLRLAPSALGGLEVRVELGKSGVMT